MGVIKTSGGLFDWLSGSRPRAPVWMQVLHLAGADAFWCVLVVLTFSVTVVATKRAQIGSR